MAKPNVLPKTNPHIALARRAVLLLLAGWPLIFLAQNLTLPFQHVTHGEGQDINFIYEILQDRQGFMWFGTYDGLVRYDGYHFKRYGYEAEDGGPIKGRKVNGLLEDALGNIWIATYKQLQILNPKQKTFYTFPDLGGDSTFSYSNPKYNEVFLQDSSGNFWLRTTRGLFCISEGHGEPPYNIKHFQHEPNDSLSLNSNNVHALLYDKHHRLWIGTEKGLNYFDREKNKVVRFDQSCNAPVTNLCETASGKICVGTKGAGLCLFDPETQTFVNYLPRENDALSIAGESVRQVVRDGKGNIWLFSRSLKTKRYSLQRFDPTNGHFNSYFESYRPGGYFGARALHLFVDRGGYLWVATGVGLKRFDPYKETFSDIHQLETYLKDWTLLNTFYEDQSGVLWIGTMSRGLLKYAPSTNKFRFYPPPLIEGKNVTGSLGRYIYEDSRGILWMRTADGTDLYAFDANNEMQKVKQYPFVFSTMLEDHRGHLWIGSSKGVKRFELTTGKWLPFHQQSEFDSLKGLGIVLEDKEEWLWVFTNRQGVLRFNPATGEIKQFRHDPEDPNSISSNFVSGKMLEDENGNIWSKGARGLNKYNPNTGNFTHYLKGIHTLGLIEDRKGRFWVTTVGDGLFRFNKETGESKRYSRKEGFPTVRPISIFKDRHGNIWMTSDVGIIHFQPDTGISRVYNKSDGLPSTVFSYGSRQRRNGELFCPLWEGGFIRFHPDSLRLDSIPPKPAIVDFQLYNKSVEIGGKDSILSQSIWATDRLVLKHHQNVFLLTAKADATSRLEGLECGADAYLAKPFDKSELLIRTKKLLELRRRLQEHFTSNGWFFQPQGNYLSGEDVFMKKLREVLEANFSDEQFDIPDLCKALHISRAQLYRKVKALTGKPAGHLLRSFRMHQAKALLETTDMNISQISLEVGFKYLAHFSRSFQQEFGINPSEMRK